MVSGGGVGKKGCQARQFKTVQDCFSAFASVKPDSSHACATKAGYFLGDVGTSPAMFVAKQVFQVSQQ